MRCSTSNQGVVNSLFEYEQNLKHRQLMQTSANYVVLRIVLIPEEKCESCAVMISIYFPDIFADVRFAQLPNLRHFMDNLQTFVRNLMTPSHTCTFCSYTYDSTSRGKRGRWGNTVLLVANNGDVKVSTSSTNIKVARKTARKACEICKHICWKLNVVNTHVNGVYQKTV